MVWSIRNKHSFLAAALLLLAASTALPQVLNNQQSDRPLEMLVLGDSILWGQGRQDEPQGSF